MQILTLKESLAVWRSISFLGHFLMISLILVSLVIPPKSHARSTNVVKEQQQQQQQHPSEVKSSLDSNWAGSTVAGQ